MVYHAGRCNSINRCVFLIRPKPREGSAGIASTDEISNLLEALQ